jgi:hypothetical protein
MDSDLITHFELDPEKLAIIFDCIDSYGVGSPDAEWANNIISSKTVVYQSGVIARNNSPVRHLVDPSELAMCQRLADEAEKLMKGVEVGMGSESNAQFQKFFIVANVDDPKPSAINEQLIRSKFGETIFPPATVIVEPLIESGAWWAEVTYDGSESGNEYFKPWKQMIEWFNGRSEFLDTAFICIGDSDSLLTLGLDKSNLPEGTEITGCVLPRLALGLTHNGSLAGLFGYTVQT